MFNLHGFISKHLDVKTLLTIGVAMVMGLVIYFSITTQREHIRERMTTYGMEMNSMAYGGIKHAMAVGDSPSIEKQLVDIGAQLRNTEIVICDFNQNIVFATDKKYIGTEVSTFTGNRETLASLKTLWETGATPRTSYFEEVEEGKKYLLTIHSILNDDECHHCHGSTRKVLGGLLTRQSTDATYAAIATLRNWTIIISIIGIGALIVMIYFLLAKLVTRPVTVLAEQAQEIARGNLSVSVPVTTEDSIGILGNSFNYMVRSIKDQIEYANSLKVAIADPMIILDTEMIITFMNQACAQLTGYSKQETEGKLSCRTIFQSDRCDTCCPLKQSILVDEQIKCLRTTITDKAGKSIPVMTSFSPLKDAHGNIIGGVEVCRDITDVLEAERLGYIKQTAEREEEQRKYFEIKAENLLNVLSLASEGELKVRTEHFEGNDVMDKVAQHVNLMLDNLEKMYNKISSFSKELEREVNRRTMMLRSRTLLLERANRELRELDRLKSSFLANMSHELRTPMNSIIGYTDLLLDRVDGEINEEQEKSLIKVDNNAKHLLQLINDILDMSKLESGKIELDIQETDLGKLVNSIVTFFEPALKTKNLFMDIEIAEQISSVFIDEDKVRQIFNNLLSNAIKFTHQGGITIQAKPSTQSISFGEKPLFVEICVQDTGIGIKKEDIRKLFDKFSQINVSANRQHEGTGLGLSIARGLVVLHKGAIWAESEFGKGTRLCFTLPVRKKVMTKSAEPIIEICMAETLAEYFNKPVELFLKELSYGGKPVKCWEYRHCGQTSCPAYGSKEHRCWLIAGTHARGIEVAKCPEKAEFCKGCEMIENLVTKGYDSPVMADEKKDVAVKTTKKTILAIDDDPEVIELVRKNIGNDYKIVGLLSGKGAVEKAKEIKPTAITLDIMMPEKDGWQVLRDLKKTPETQDIPVIILSIVDEKKMGISLGAAEYMVKPIDKKMLLHKLKNLEKLTSIKNVLVVDDEAGTVDTLAQVLKEEGYKITTAYTNKEAIGAIAVSKPDLIVLNLIMPDANGFDIIEYIKTEEKMRNVPLILITRKDLSKEYIRELDGRIQATLNKGILSEQDLLEQLKQTIKKM